MADMLFVLAVILFFGVTWSLAIVEPGNGTRTALKETTLNVLRITGGLFALGLLIYVVVIMLKFNLPLDTLSRQHTLPSSAPTLVTTSTKAETP